MRCLVPGEIRRHAIIPELIQGRWRVLHAVGPDGQGFEGSNLFVVITGDKAKAPNGTELRLEFNADHTALKLYRGNELAGTVRVTLTVAEPIQMLWADQDNPRQETLLEKEP